jgi:hypothetical protein
MAALPPGASKPPPPGEAPSFEDSPLMGGFDVTFFLPFARQEVYRELMVQDNPLGTAPDLTTSLLRPGYVSVAEAGTAVSRARTRAHVANAPPPSPSPSLPLPSPSTRARAPALLRLCRRCGAARPPR